MLENSVPVRLESFHNRHYITDKVGRYLFEITVLRPSIEAWEELKEFGMKTCEIWNQFHLPVSVITGEDRGMEDVPPTITETTTTNETLQVPHFNGQFSDEARANFTIEELLAIELVKKSFVLTPKRKATRGRLKKWLVDLISEKEEEKANA